MIRAAFLRRMGMAALATLLFEVRVPELESEPWDDGVVWVNVRQEYTVARVRIWHDGELIHDGPNLHGRVPLVRWDGTPVDMAVHEWPVPREMLS